MTYYNSNAPRLFDLYQSVSSDAVHSFWLDLLPNTPGTACDIGAGSGRDAAWLATEGWEVTAVEPSKKLRLLGESFTAQLANLKSSVTWLDDSLPKMPLLVSAGKKFDLIILSAVWMHLPATQHFNAMSTLKCLLNQHGLLVISLRNGPDPENRFFKTSIDELIAAANLQSLQLVREHRNQKDAYRLNISWDSAVFTLSGRSEIHGANL